jgi:RNA polymerase sigma factor (sigma-70 family)
VKAIGMPRPIGARVREAASRDRLPGEEVARLVARAADGDHGAWNALVDAFGGVVWATTRAYRLSGPDAADVVQTTWMRLVGNLDRIHDPACLGSWLATTARRECLAEIRRARRVVPQGDDLPEPSGDVPHPGARLIEEQRTVALRTALERLAPRDRALLRMLAAEPAPSYEEIGAALDLAVGSIGPTRARALARLRREAARVGLTGRCGS